MKSENGTTMLAPSITHLKKKEQQGFCSFEDSEWRLLSSVSEQTQYHIEIHIPGVPKKYIHVYNDLYSFSVIGI